MKTYSQFCEEMRYALDNLRLEADGFGEYVKKRRKNKDKYMSKRDQKIQKLRKSKSHWSGLV